MRDVQPHYDLQLSTLEALASARRYNSWIAALALPHLGDHPIEIGSGLGDQAHLWLEAGLGRITLSDLERRSVDALQARFRHDDRVDVRLLDLATCEPGDYSAVVAVNVLEHIVGDRAALAAAARLVRPGGKVIVFVPAFPMAMSRFDRDIGHIRRYRRRTLTARLLEVGLRPSTVHYVNAPGLLAWMVMMKVLRGRPQEGLGLRLWDDLVVPITRRVEQRVRPPFGQSLLAVGIADGSS
jgi:SAM-dependent methyltransferase